MVQEFWQKFLSFYHNSAFDRQTDRRFGMAITALHSTQRGEHED